MAKKKKQQRAGGAVSQNSIDSINDTIITQQPAKPANDKVLNGTISSGSNIAATSRPGASVSSSFDRSAPIQQQQQQQPESSHEPYRPPVISHERINPFDKNTTPSHEAKPTGIYSTLTSNNSVPASPSSTASSSPKPAAAAAKQSVTGFDYSYKPPVLPPAPILSAKPIAVAESIETAATTTATATSDAAQRRHEFERKLSDADIIFGAIAKPAADTYKSTYSRNRSNSSFTSTSTDSDYIYGARDARKDHSFQKSLSVSSDTDGDFTHDPTVAGGPTRAYQGISNDAFSDYDSPNKASATQVTQSWSNNDDEFDLK